MHPRVVITGLGIAGPLGLSATDTWSSLIAGASGARRITIEGFGDLTAFPVTGADEAVRDLVGARDVRRMDRVGHLAVLAAAGALADAGSPPVPAARIGAAIGCIHGGAHTLEAASRTHWQNGLDRVGPLTIPLGLTNSAVAAVARTVGVRGPTAVTGTACAAGTDAIGTGLAWIRLGQADLVLVGGADAPLVPLVVAGYHKLGALSRRDGDPAAASRPFDTDRDGFVIAEGAAVLVLESEALARARGARIYAEVAGFGQTCDAGHLTDPDPAGSGAAGAIGLALADAGAAPAEVDYVNAHATSTPAGDRAEARALAAAGLGAARVSSTKGAHGHPLGAAGAVEALITTLAVHHGVLPPTRNLVHPDPEISLRHVTAPEKAELTVAISNSFGFGGHNACLVIRGSGPPPDGR